jgi:hypothetical protein
MVPVLVSTLEKFWFRFWFQLLKSSGSGSGSYFRKVPVPVPGRKSNTVLNFISISGSDFLTCYGSGLGSTTVRSCPAHDRVAWPAAGWSSGGRWGGAARPPSAPPPLPLARCSLRMRDPPVDGMIVIIYVPVARVADPDPYWLRTRIQNPDPDPGGKNDPQK